jgi:outer membrane protein assembly factor BamC
MLERNQDENGETMNQQYLVKAIGACVFACVITACDSIPFIDNTSDYKGAGRSKPLEVPPDLTAIRTSDAYAVPGSATYSGYSQDQEGQEVGVEQVLPNAEGVRMEKAGAQRWLVVTAPAEKIWPVIREFWLDQGFAVRVENAETGVMETEWIEADAIKLKDDSRNVGEKFDAWLDKLSGLADRRKFRTRLERGEKEGTTEIYMTHRTVAGAPDDGKNVVNTQLGKIETGYRIDAADKKLNTAEQFDSDLDVELLRRLMVKLGVAEKQAQQIAANPVSSQRATVVKESDSSVTLNINDSFDRGWRRVGLALDRVGFVTEDKDRSQGIFFVRYADVDIDDTPKKKKGLLDTLKFWGDDEEEKNNPKPKDEKSIAEKLKFWKGKDEKTDPAKQYRIKVSEKEDGTSSVNVVDAEGKRNPSTTANRIISLLYDQLK